MKANLVLRVMEYSQRSYNHKEEVIVLYVSMRNVETESNRRRDKQEPITMRSLLREVKTYKADNERIMKAHEEILQSLSMLHKKVNKDSGSHRKMDDHGNYRHSRSMRRCHHYPRKSTRRTHASLGARSSLSVSHVWRQRIRLEGDILQGELRKIKPPNFNGKNRKGEEVEA
jgi:hypothetical protein